MTNPASIYKVDQARKWANWGPGGLSPRDTLLFEAWLILSARRPALTEMHVVNGLAYDGHDPSSPAIPVRVSRAAKGK